MVRKGCKGVKKDKKEREKKTIQVEFSQKEHLANRKRIEMVSMRCKDLKTVKK